MRCSVAADRHFALETLKNPESAAGRDAGVRLGG
jgi:hypothetical protein